MNRGRKEAYFPFVLLKLYHVYYLKSFYLEKFQDLKKKKEKKEKVQDSSYSSMKGLLDGKKDFLGSGRMLKRSWHSGLCEHFPGGLSLGEHVLHRCVMWEMRPRAQVLLAVFPLLPQVPSRVLLGSPTCCLA